MCKNRTIPPQNQKNFDPPGLGGLGEVENAEAAGILWFPSRSSVCTEATDLGIHFKTPTGKNHRIS